MIERACIEDVAFRVVAAQQRPDHATIARFIEHHEAALAGLFGEVFLLCSRSGLAQVGVIANDGTKVHANAGRDANADYEQIAREIIEEAKAIDAAEDELYGDARGDECLSIWRPGRAAGPGCARPSDAWRASATSSRGRCRVPGPSASRKPSGAWREELWTETRANAAYEHYRATGRLKNGRRVGAHSPPEPYTPPAKPEGRINTTDPDSHVVKGLRGFIQGYNAQAVTNEHQIVIAAEITSDSPDFGHLRSMVNAAEHELAAVGVTARPDVVLADAGYWHQDQMEAIVIAASRS